MQNSKNLSSSMNFFMNDLSNFHSKEPKNLRKIKPTDRFPCFACYDDPKEKTSCQQCGTLGYLLGSHPMVQFAEDFIEKKFANTGCTETSPNNSGGSDTISINKNMSSSDHSRKKDVMPGLSTKTVHITEPEENREVLRSKFANEEEGIRDSATRSQTESMGIHQYFCDGCVNGAQIRGTRYHCLQCEDYDLCENCFNRGLHCEHSFKQLKGMRKPQGELIAAQFKYSLQKKSINYSK